MCLNCNRPDGKKGRKFWSDVPACECGVDGRKPEYRAFIIRCVVHHYVPPHPVIQDRGTGFRLCDGKAVRSHNTAVETSTGAVSVVDCPACLAHPDFPTPDDGL